MTTGQRTRTPDCAARMEQMRINVARGDRRPHLFRQGVLQIMKWYDSAVESFGLVAGIAEYERTPGSTGDAGLDAAFAALADWHADRDGWTAPAWTSGLVAPEPWYAADHPAMMRRAHETCPPIWRAHNVWISERALLRPQDSRPEEWLPAS